VLVGDDYQLPPLVVNLEAQPPAVCSLTIQYRIIPDIMSVCNTLIYEHSMTCALPVIASASLHLPRIQLIPSPRSEAPAITKTDWLYDSILPQSAVDILKH
jgi:DNA replication ATP-dependent helicase Dna2